MGAEAVEAAWALVDMRNRRPDHSNDTDSTTTIDVEVIEVASILVNMKRGSRHHDSDSYSTDTDCMPTTGQLTGGFVSSQSSETNSRPTTEDLATRTDEMSSTKRVTWADEPSAKDKKPVAGQQSDIGKHQAKRREPAEDEQSARDKKPATGQQSEMGKHRAKRRKTVEGKLPANIQQPDKDTTSSFTQPYQRSSLLDDPELVRRSEKIDQEIGFPGGPTKENSDEWLNKKIGYIMQQTKERHEKSWVQLQAADDAVAMMRREPLPGLNDVPPYLMEPSDDNELPGRRTRAQARMSHEKRHKASSEARGVTETQGDDDETISPEPIQSSMTPPDEGSAQSNPKGQKEAKKRTRIILVNRPSQPRD